MLVLAGAVALLVLASSVTATPVKPFSDYLPNEHCPSWQLFNNECKDFYYEVSCYCDAECSDGNCSNFPRFDDPDARSTNFSYGELIYKDGLMVSVKSICCRNPFSCKQECMPLKLRLVCPSAPADWSMSSCPYGFFSNCTDDSDCSQFQLCCPRHSECGYGCLYNVDKEDPWY